MLVGVMLRRARNAITELGGRTQARLAATGSLQVPVEAVNERDGAALASGVAAITPLPHGRILATPQASLGGGLLCSADKGRTWAARCP